MRCILWEHDATITFLSTLIEAFFFLKKKDIIVFKYIKIIYNILACMLNFLKDTLLISVRICSSKEMP